MGRMLSKLTSPQDKITNSNSLVHRKLIESLWVSVIVIMCAGSWLYFVLVFGKWLDSV